METESKQAKLNGKAQVIHIRVPMPVKKKMDVIQKKKGVSINKMLIDMLLEFIAREK